MIDSTTTIGFDFSPKEFNIDGNKLKT